MNQRTHIRFRSTIFSKNKEKEIPMPVRLTSYAQAAGQATGSSNRVMGRVQYVRVRSTCARFISQGVSMATSGAVMSAFDLVYCRPGSCCYCIFASKCAAPIGWSLKACSHSFHAFPCALCLGMVMAMALHSPIFLFNFLAQNCIELKPGP